MKRLIKFLHELGTVGLMGATATQLVLSYAAEGMASRDYAVTRLAILRVSELLLIPSLLVVLVSGLLAMLFNSTFQKRGWALLKAGLTLVVLQCALVAVQGPAKQAAVISVAIVKGDRSQARHLPEIVRHERGGSAMLLFLSVVNIALAVWRPRLRRKRSPASA